MAENVAPDSGQHQAVDAELHRRLILHSRFTRGDAGGEQLVLQPTDDFSGITAIEAGFHRAVLDGALFRDAVLRGSNFYGASLSRADFTGADLRKALFQRCDSEGVAFNRARLDDSNFHESSFRNGKFVGATLRRASLSSGDLQGADFTDADLREAQLGRSVLSKRFEPDAAPATLRNTDLRRADLQDVNLHKVDLRNAKGLFGPERALNLERVVGAETAVYSSRLDRMSWERLRFISTLHFFSASYVGVLFIVLYTTAIRWCNDKVIVLREWALLHDQDPSELVRFLAGVLRLLPELPRSEHFGRLLLSFALLAAATTIFALRCPDLVKESTEDRWVHELKGPLVQYRSANYSRALARYATALLFAIGGIYSFFYLVVRAYFAVAYLLTPPHPR